MTTIRASKIQQALQKAQNIGLIEDEFTLMGMTLVLRNLRPSELQAIVQEVEGLDDAEYLFEFQKSHVCRSLLQVNDIDLRGVEFVEDEVPQGAWTLTVLAPDEATASQVKEAALKARCQATVQPPDGETRSVVLELPEWLRKNVVSTWSREVVSTTYRKFAELLVKADEEATKGVSFSIPEETAEERARRLVGELKEVEGEAQREILAKILDEAGYAFKVDQDQKAAQAAVDRLDQIVPEPQPQQPDPTQLMRDRTPMNRAAPPQEASPTVQPQPQPDRAPSQGQAPPTSMARQSKRSEEIAAMEQEPHALTAVEPPQPGQPRLRRAGAEIRSSPLNPQEVRNILDQPPTGGLNPKWKPSQ